MWNKVSEKKLPHRECVIAFNKKWIDEEWNRNRKKMIMIG